MKTLMIGNIEIPVRSSLEIEQTYEPIGRETILRTTSGLGIKQQVSWNKIRTVISGSGWMPTGLAQLDTSIIQTVACVVPRSVSTSFDATLPLGRRFGPGYDPWGQAVMPDHGVVEVPLLADPYSTGAFDLYAINQGVQDALGYHIFYYPLLSCWIQRPIESGNRGDASYRWELVCEEV